MQTLSTAARTAFEQGLSLKAIPQVIVDWNHNRFADSVTASVVDAGQETGKVEKKLFPIESIVYANRPTSGLGKGRVNEARTNGNFKLVSKNAHYKYWQSSMQSAPGYVAAPAYGYPITNMQPTVTYGAAVNTNKIVIKIENAWTVPSQWTVDILPSGGSWTTIAINPSLSSTGELVLYRQNGGAWNGTVNYGYETPLTAVRISVDSITKGNAHLSVIEISAHLQKDISADVMNVEVSKRMADTDVISPVGTVGANTANITLDTTAGTYDLENTSGPYYNLLDMNAEVRVAMGIDTTNFGGTGIEYIPQGVFYADNWAIDSARTQVQLTTTDFTKFLQDLRIAPFLFNNKTVPWIIREVLRAHGVTNYNIPLDTREPIVPWVWFDEEDTVWSAIQSLCRASQGVVYFDEQGNAVYLSKDSLFDGLATVDYAVQGIKVGAVEANLETLSHSYNTETNKVVITYTPTITNKKTVKFEYPTGYSSGKNTWFDLVSSNPGNTLSYATKPINSILWQPEDTVALQSARLATSVNDTATTIRINESDARTWQFKGKINIEGEIMSFDGKTYKWYQNGSNAPTYTTVTSVEEQAALDGNSNPMLKSQNKYTGDLKNVVRGIDGTSAAAHTIDIQGWTTTVKSDTNSISSGSGRARQEQSSLVLSGATGNNGYEWYTMSSRGSNADSYSVYGARMRFAVVQAPHATGGIFFHRQSDGISGYFIEFNTTAFSTNVLKGNVANIRAYRQFADGHREHLPAGVDDIKYARGIDYNIVPGQWFDIEVTYDKVQRRCVLYVNGQRMIDWIDNKPGPFTSGNWGTWVRGGSTALWEYFYVNNTQTNTPPSIDDSNFYNKIYGGFTSGYASKEVQRSSVKKLDWFFDEFGAYCHEIREFDVKFDKIPTVRPYLYLTNDWDAFVMDAQYTPFGAKFEIANAGRDIAVLNGDDYSVVFGENVSQKLMIFGQLVFSEDTKQETVKNDDAIRRRGEVVLEVESKWIQTASHAKNYGTFITTHWAEPADNIEVEVFINPAVQVGDTVSVNWPARNFLPATHKYFVSSISLGYDNGISGTLSLRRAR